MEPYLQHVFVLYLPGEKAIRQMYVEDLFTVA